MKLNKKQAGLIAGVVCVILLVILLLSMCKSSGGQNEPVQPVESVDPVTETTEAAEETTEATAETTEATEETTEATEEATEPTTGGSTRPGGTGGPGLGSGGNTDDSTATQPTTPKAGSEESPYMEVVAEFPDSVNTVAIPAEGTVHYNLNLNDESIAAYGESLLVIAAEDAYVVYNETKYEAKDGVVSVPLAAVTEEDVPVAIQICNTGKEAKTFLLSLDAPLGTVDNPEELQRGENGELFFEASLEAEDKDGYHFDFLAERDGTLKLQLDSITENAACDIIVTAGEASVTLSSDMEDPAVTMDFKKGDMVTVQVIAKAAEDETYPAAELKLSGTADYYGSKTNPIVVNQDFTTEEMEPGMVLYYLVEDQSGMALNVEHPAYVIYNDKTYQAPAPEEAEPDDSEDTEGTEGTEGTEEDAPAIVSVKIGNSDDSALMAIGNGGEEPAEFDVTFGYPAGNVENKAPMVIKNVDEAEDGTNTAVIESGDTDVYWFTWTNDVDAGILTIKMPASGSWKYVINHTSSEKTTVYEMCSDSENVQRTINLLLAYGDVVDIQVCTYDPADQTALPEGSVTFDASFLTHFQTNASGDTWLTLDGNAMVYCKQGLKYADGTIMTVVAVETDEEGNAITDAEGNVTVLTDSAFTIDYEGTVYTAENGTIVIEGIEMESTDPDIFSLVNDSAETSTYRISFSYPEGHQSNPKVIGVGKYQIELAGDGGSGYFYSWTTTQPGTFYFEIDPSTFWTYNISSTVDTAVFSSTQNGSSTDVDPDVEITIGKSHISSSKDGSVTITINLGNPSSDPENKSLISFEIGTYNKKITGDDTVKVAAGEEYPLMQMLDSTSANGMVITGADSFTVVYDGKEHVSENGVVTVSNFIADKAFFQIINNSAAEQTYTIALVYPVGSEKNPEPIETGEVNVDLFLVGDGYYYFWTADSNGEFKFEIPSSYLWTRPWKYEIRHGEATYSGQQGNMNALVQSFDVKAGDVVTIKMGIVRAVANSQIVPFTITFTEAASVSELSTHGLSQNTEYAGERVPEAYNLILEANQQLAYIDLTQKYELYLNKENGCYYLSENGPAVLVDFSSDAFVNLKKLLETEELYAELTAEDGTVTRETYNALLQKYMDCAAVIAISDEKTATLYPLTEDLMYILKNVGAQLGWYDSANAAYKFADVPGSEADSLWMFSCGYVQTVEVQPVTPEQSESTTAETSEDEVPEESSESEVIPTDSEAE